MYKYTLLVYKFFVLCCYTDYDTFGRILKDINIYYNAQNKINKLRDNGKHPKQCMVAVARKLAVKAYYDLLKCHDQKV